MSLGFWASVIVGVGVAGHAVVGSVLTTRAQGWTRRWWRRFGKRSRLVRLNGTLLVVASVLHLIISVAKTYSAGWLVLSTSVAPLLAFAAAGWQEWRAPARTSWRWHHTWMAVGWIAFGAHAAVAGGAA